MVQTPSRAASPRRAAPRLDFGCYVPLCSSFSLFCAHRPLSSVDCSAGASARQDRACDMVSRREQLKQESGSYTPKLVACFYGAPP